MRDGVAKRLPEPRAEVALRIAVQPFELGRRPAMTLVGHGRVRADDGLQAVGAAPRYRTPTPGIATILAWRPVAIKDCNWTGSHFRERTPAATAAGEAAAAG